jgi:hypothetical protein
MRRRGGKGQAIAFDAELAVRIEKMKKELGFYPSLRVIAHSYDPPYSYNHIFLRLRALASEGRLSAEAAKVYGEKHNKEKDSGKEKSVKAFYTKVKK